MLPSPRLVLALLLALLPSCSATIGYWITCAEIGLFTALTGKVYWPGSPQYKAALGHWSSLNQESSACVVEPSNTGDLTTILRIIGLNRTPFAVKGGGHGTNPGFSSTKGVHISMAKFNKVRYDSRTKIAEVGAGLTWDDVYAALEPHKVNVVGGRLTGVGVAGFTLGGGYSWLSNQYGLTVDNVVAFELVRPDGRVVKVDKQSDSQLFFGLKGGGNNFGIVTNFFFKTYPQPHQVWGGMVLYPQSDELNAAISNFSANVLDPKAGLFATYHFSGALGFPASSALLFYDASTPPDGIFNSFLSLPSLFSTVGTKSFANLIKGFTANDTYGQRTIFHTASPIKYGTNFLKAIQNETVHWSQILPVGATSLISYSVEPFVPSLYSKTTDETAFPYSRANPFTPFNVCFSWVSQGDDTTYLQAARRSISQLEAAAVADGDNRIDAQPLYSNYALEGTSLERIYGSNLATLRTLKRRIDPFNIMGLAGGWKF